MTRRPDDVDPNAYALRAVLKGEAYARAVEGGVRRGPAPADGLVLALADREVFLPARDVDAAMGELDRRVRGAAVPQRS